MSLSSRPNETSVRRLMQAGVDEGVFPGAVLVASCGEEVLLHDAWGVADLATRRPVRVDTVFDLASLTKPLATALVVMRLVQAGRLTLDAPIGRILPVMADTDKAGVTVRHLLNHCSGWPDWRPYFEELRRYPEEARRERLAALLAAEPLTAAPGSAWVYSDLDYLALGLMLETLTGLRLDRLAQREIFEPLGIRDLFFNPLDTVPAPRDYGATERCHWRGGVLVGAVHDDNAWALAGVAGHAGLFGTAAGILTLLRVLLRNYHGEEGSVWLSPPIVRAMWTRIGGSGWALGFDTPSPRGSSSGRYFSQDSVGHLGFTGTSFWIDIHRRIAVILLTNRVHPDRSNDRIRRFRPRIHDEVMEWILQKNAPKRPQSA